MRLQQLECRETPASVAVTYSDLDGDLVRITASRVGTIAPPLDAGDLEFVAGGISGQLSTLVLDNDFDGAKIVFSVTKRPGGDGLAHVGYINAGFTDLDAVIVRGDLGRINVGDDNVVDDPGLNLLDVRSLGKFGRVTQGGFGDLSSLVTGSLGTLKVGGDVRDVFFQASGSIGSVTVAGSVFGGAASGSGTIGSSGDIGSVTIRGNLVGAGASSGQVYTFSKIGSATVGGSIIGGGDSFSGMFFATDGIGPVKIGKSIIGGAGERSGIVGVGESARIASVTVGGLVTGGSGPESGGIFAGDPSPGTSSLASLGPVRIGGSLQGGSTTFAGAIFSQGGMGLVQIGRDVVGGAGFNTGTVFSRGQVGQVNIGGDLLGGPVSGSGHVFSSGPMGAVNIGGDMVGGSVSGSAFASDVGAISGKRIASVTIGGSIIAGADNSTEMLLRSGAITAQHDIGPILIKGSLVGRATPNGASFVLISARGQEVLEPGATTDLAIASLTVRGSVTYAKVRAGFTSGNNDFIGTNGNASMGPVLVGGDWASSSITAGIQDGGAVGFGTPGDSLISGAGDAIIARIVGIAIVGEVSGSAIAGDNFGFVAQQIDKANVHRRILTLGSLPGSPPDNILIPFTDDVRFLEVT